MKRNLSITLVAMAQFGISALSLVSGLTLLLLITGRLEIFSADLTQLSDYFKGLVIFGLFVSIWGIVSSIGLWRLQKWGMVRISAVSGVVYSQQRADFSGR